MAMEVLIYSIAVGLLWVASTTILIPFVILLKFNKTVQNLWFAIIYSQLIMPLVNNKIQFLRKMCLNMLKDSLTSRDVSVSLRVLEIGVGPGLNLKYYPENSSLIVLDPNPMFEKYFLKNRAQYPQVRLEKSLQCGAEDMKDVATSSIDAVVCTYVLCSVDDMKKTLSEIYRVLKPGGHFVFLEHVVFPLKHPRARKVQKAMAPLWYIYAGGCRLCQDPKHLIQGSGFSNVSIKQMLPDFANFFIRPHLIGISTK